MFGHGQDESHPVSEANLAHDALVAEKQRDTLAVPGSESRGRTSLGTINQHSVLSTATLGEHDKSMSGTEGEKTDGVDRIATWVSGVYTGPVQNTQEPDTDGQETVDEQVTPGISLRRQSLVEPGQIEASSSRERMEHIHRLLTTDGNGRELPLKPSPFGRYHAHRSDDFAFAHIAFNDLAIVRDPESVTPQRSDHSISSMRTYKSAAVEKLKRARYLSKMSNINAQGENDPQAETSCVAKQPSDVTVSDKRRYSVATETSMTASSGTGLRSETTGYTSMSLNSSAFGSRAGARIDGKATLRMVTGLRKWRGKARKHGAPSLKTFANDEDHYKYMQGTMENIAVEMPLPLKKVLLEEASQIIKDTVKDYKRTLGKRDMLTVKAAAKLEEIQKLTDLLDNI